MLKEQTQTGGHMTTSIYQDILRDAKTELQPFVVSDGQLIAQLNVNVFTVRNL
jgi:hypothetical protein